MLVISNHSPDYSLNCTPLSPITITNGEVLKVPLNFKDQLVYGHFIPWPFCSKDKELFLLLS